MSSYPISPGGDICLGVGGCKDRMRKDALKHHVIVTPGTALLLPRRARCTRLGVLTHVERATPVRDRGEEQGEEAGRSPPSRGRASLPGHVWAGRSNWLSREATVLGLCCLSTPAAPPEAIHRPRSPNYPSTSAIYGEVRMGREGCDGDGGRETRSRGCGGSPATVADAPRRPPSPRSFASRAGRARRRAGPGRVWPRREEELAEGPWPCPLPGLLPSPPAQPADPRPRRPPSRRLAVTSLWNPPHTPGLKRAPIRAPAPQASSYLARPPSIFFLLLSFSHSQIGQGVEVTPRIASGSDAKAAFSLSAPRKHCNYSVGWSFPPPHGAESSATVVLTMVCRGERREASSPA